MKTVILSLLALGTVSAYAKNVEVLNFSTGLQYEQGMIGDERTGIQEHVGTYPMVLTGATSKHQGLVKVQCHAEKKYTRAEYALDRLYFNDDKDQVRLSRKDCHQITNVMRNADEFNIVLSKESGWKFIGITRHKI